MANVLVGQRLSRLRVSDVYQRANQWCVASRVGPAGLENVVGESMKAGTGSACAPSGGGRQPPRGADRPYGAIGDVGRGGAKRHFQQRIGPCVEVQTKHRLSQHLQRQSTALVIEVEFRAVAPRMRKLVGALGHVLGELRHVLLGEQWLQCASAGQPRVVFQVE